LTLCTVSEVCFDRSDARVSTRAAVGVAQAIISLDEQVVPFLASGVFIHEFAARFPVYPLEDSREGYVECVQDNLILYTSFETVIALNLKQKCRSRDFQAFAEAIVNRLPALIELGNIVSKESPDMESKLVLVGRNIIKHLKKTMDRSIYKKTMAVLPRQELERLKTYLT
jgi:hypothetical protein